MLVLHVRTRCGSPSNHSFIIMTGECGRYFKRISCDSERRQMSIIFLLRIRFSTVTKILRFIRGLYCILIETSQPPLDIFSYILTDMKHTWVQFTLNMEKSIKQKLSKFHFHKLKSTCSLDRLYKGTIAFHFHTNAKFELIP